MKKKNNTEPLLLLPHELDRWPLKYSSIPDQRIMVFLLNLVRVTKFTARERLNKKIGTSRYNLLVQVTRNVLDQIEQNPAKVRAEVWYQSTNQIKHELSLNLGLPSLDYNLYELMIQVTMKVAKDYTKLQEPGKVKKHKKPEKLPVVEKPKNSPKIIVKKKIKLPPKIIIVE